MQQLDDDKKSFNGYPTFIDVEDFELRAKNRGQIMCNIIDDHTEGSKMSARGAADLMEYCSLIPAHDKELAITHCKFIINSRKPTLVH